MSKRGDHWDSNGADGVCRACWTEHAGYRKRDEEGAPGSPARLRFEAAERARIARLRAAVPPPPAPDYAMLELQRVLADMEKVEADREDLARQMSRSPRGFTFHDG